MTNSEEGNEDKADDDAEHKPVLKPPINEIKAVNPNPSDNE